MNNEEHVVWQDTPSQIVNLSTFVWCTLLCWLLVPIFIALYKWLTVRCHRYELTTQRFRVTTGILSKHTDELELYRVKDISLSEPFLLRLFSLGNIVLNASDKSTPIVVIEAIPNATSLREEIRKHVEGARERKRVREIDFE